MKGKLLLTGFEPFGEDRVNPSGDVAKSLDGTEVNGYEVVSRVLPVEWGTVKDMVEAFMDKVRPGLVLSLGLAGGRAEVSVEKVAVNYTSKSKDNAGVIPAERPIVSGGADAYFATIPAEEVVDEINKRGIPARLSLSAGAYLCNYAFYCASRHAREKAAKTQVGFIHIPPAPEMVAGKSRGGPSMAKDLVTEAVRQALTTCTSSFTNSG